MVRVMIRSRFLLASLAAVAVAGCAKAPSGFRAVDPQQNIPTIPGCGPNTTAKKLQIFVMVDNSGSTSSTDQNQSIRVQTLRNFLANYGSHSNLHYGFGYFDDDAYVYDMNQGGFVMNSASVPFGGAGGEIGALDTYHASIPPSGNTGYSAAFSAIQSAITRDESTGIVADYAVVFMSDGQPTDIDGNVQAGISTLVSNLKAATAANGKSHLVVSTVYFGSASDSTSIQNLQSMANHGGGQFVDTNHLSSGGLSIDDLITIPGC
jgi:hypothetical protein